MGREPRQPSTTIPVKGHAESECALRVTWTTTLIKAHLKAVGHQTLQCDKCGRWASPHCDCANCDHQWLSRIPIPQTGYGCVVWCFVKKWGACIHALSGQSFVFVWLWLSGVRTNIQDNSFAYHVAMILQKPMGLNIWPLISLTSNLSFQGSGLITVTGAKLVHEVL